MPRVEGETSWRPTEGEGGWVLRKVKPPGHACALPELDPFYSTDTWLKRWAWRCDVCERFYRVVECHDESAFAPLWQWERCWPWEERRLRIRWDRSG